MIYFYQLILLNINFLFNFPFKVDIYMSFGASPDDWWGPTVITLYIAQIDFSRVEISWAGKDPSPAWSFNSSWAKNLSQDDTFNLVEELLSSALSFILGVVMTRCLVSRIETRAHCMASHLHQYGLFLCFFQKKKPSVLPPSASD